MKYILKQFPSMERFKKNGHLRRTLVAAAILVAISIVIGLFVSSNQNYYDKTIARIISIEESVDSDTIDRFGNEEQLMAQIITAVVVNGPHEGKTVELENIYSFSQVADLKYFVEDEVFVSISADEENNIESAYITEFKRDKYLAFITLAFAGLIILIGGVKGFRSLVSVGVNVILVECMILLFVRGFSLLALSVAASLLFVILSLSIVSGINKKTFSAIVGTFASTLAVMLITAVVIIATNAEGIQYDSMEFLTRPPTPIFYSGILIGTLGGIMDIAITMSSAVQELYETTPGISREKLVHSGMAIGQDIMGIMSNTLVFAYISGSVPGILLWLKNGFYISSILSINLSLEIIRALVGSIGIVVSIPVTLYISIWMLTRGKIGEAK